MRTPTWSRPRRALIDAGATLAALGLNPGSSGNLSVRAGDGLLITPSGVPYVSIRPSQIVLMDMDGGHVGNGSPSSEWRMHRDIYLRRPQAAAIVHTHSLYATALSCLGNDVPAFHYMIAVTGGASLRCARYATVGTEALSRHALEALEDRSACLLANHGMICFGPSLETSVRLAREIETLCNQYVIACQMGEPSILGTREMNRVLALFQTYGKQSD